MTTSKYELEVREDTRDGEIYFQADSDTPFMTISAGDYFPSGAFGDVPEWGRLFRVTRVCHCFSRTDDCQLLKHKVMVFTEETHQPFFDLSSQG